MQLLELWQATDLWRHLLRWIRLAPVTAEALVICLAIFVGTVFQSASDHEQFDVIQRQWGAIQSLERQDFHDGIRRTNLIELIGPFDVWNGEWWRIPLTVFHHQHFTHLLFTVAVGLYLGRLLEEKWGSLAMGFFLIPASAVPIVIELAAGNASMGFSGAACAMLGALTVLRQFDDQLSKSFPFEIAFTGLAMILLGSVATHLSLIQLDSIAHISGFAYGAAVALATVNSHRFQTLVRFGVIMFHILLIPSLILVTNPFWIGRFHWHQASSARNLTTADTSLKKAIDCDPSLAGAWLQFSRIAEEKQDLLEAWRRIVRGISINPTSLPLIDSARRLWRHLNPDQRHEGVRILKQAFPGRTAVWLNSIKAITERSDPAFDGDQPDSLESSNLSAFALDQQIDIPVLNFSESGSQHPGRLDADAQNNAAEGLAF